MIPKNKLTKEQILAVLRPLPDGNFLWLADTGHAHRKGKQAGGLNKDGYVRIKIFGNCIFGHHIMWFLKHGVWPVWKISEIDHKNGIRHDNRLSNLRKCDVREQQQNRKLNKNNRSGYPNVYWDSSKEKWLVRIKRNKASHYFGEFLSVKEAAAVARAAKAELHKFNPVHRFKTGVL